MASDFIKRTDASPVSLDDLARRINQAHEGAIRSARTAIEYAIECGRLLTEAKAFVGHGGWLIWLEENTVVSKRTAQRWMRYAENADALLAKCATDGAFTFGEADQLLAPPKVEETELDGAGDDAAEHAVVPPPDEPEELETVAAREPDGDDRTCIDLVPVGEAQDVSPPKITPHNASKADTVSVRPAKADWTLPENATGYVREVASFRGVLPPSKVGATKITVEPGGELHIDPSLPKAPRDGFCTYQMLKHYLGGTSFFRIG